MKAIYTYTGSNQVVHIPSGAGYQRVLVWFEDSYDWFVYFCDDLRAMAYIHKIVNKTLPYPDIFDASNLEVLPEEQHNACVKWINDNYNYQGIHKDEKVDG